MAGRSAVLAIKILAEGSQAKKGFRDVSDEAGKTTADVESKFSKMGSHLSGVFSKLGDLGLGAGIAAAFTSAASQAQNGAKLRAALGITPAQAAGYAKTAGAVYADNWGQSLDDVDGAIRDVRTQLGDMGQGQLKNITEQAIAFRDTFGADTQESVRAVAQLIQTGLAKNAKQAFDILTKGEQTGADRAGDLLDTFNEYGTQFRKLGIKGPQALGLINQGLKAGARNSDLVGDALKEFSIRAVDGSKATAQGFQSLGLNADKMAHKFTKGGTAADAGLAQVLSRLRKIPDPVQRSQTAVKLFGTQAEDLGNALYALDPSAAKTDKSLKGLAGSTKKMADATSASANPFDVLKRQVQGTVSRFSSNLIPVVKTFSGVIEHAGPEVVGLGVAIGGLLVVMKVAQGIRAIKKAMTEYEVITKIQTGLTKAQAVAQGILNAVMEANPIILVVTALVALVAAFVIAYKKSATFRRIVKGAFHAVADIAKSFAHFFTQKIPAAFRYVVDFAGRFAHGVIDKVLGMSRRVRQIVGDIVGFFRDLPGRIAGFVGHMGSVGLRLLGAFWNGMKRALGGIGNFAGDMARTIVNTIVNGINSVLHLPWRLNFNIPIPFAPDIHIGPYTLLPRIPLWGSVDPDVQSWTKVLNPETLRPGFSLLADTFVPAAPISSSSSSRSESSVTYNVSVNFNGLVTDPEGTAKAVRDVINNSARRRGLAAQIA